MVSKATKFFWRLVEDYFFIAWENCLPGSRTTNTCWIFHHMSLILTKYCTHTWMLTCVAILWSCWNFITYTRYIHLWILYGWDGIGWSSIISRKIIMKKITTCLIHETFVMVYWFLVFRGKIPTLQQWKDGKAVKICNLDLEIVMHEKHHWWIW